MADLDLFLHQTIRLNHPVDPLCDTVHPGTVHFWMENEDGETSVVSISFGGYWIGTDHHDPSVLHVICQNPDPVPSRYQLEHITGIAGWQIITEAVDGEPLRPIEVTDVWFRVYGSPTKKTVFISNIPVRFPIGPKEFELGKD